MDLASAKALRSLPRYFIPSSLYYPHLLRAANSHSSTVVVSPSLSPRRRSLICHGKKRDSYYTRPVPRETTVKEKKVMEEAEEDLEEAAEELEIEADEEYIDDLGDDMLADDTSDFEGEFQDVDEDSYLRVGDGGGGGGVSLAGTWWDKQALTIAEEVSNSFSGDLKIYAFKTSANSSIRLRIEKMSNKYGSPTMDDIEAFTSAFRLRLDEAESAGTIPNDISLEVSSPGVERVVRVPEELERFKDRPMYVRYTTRDAETGTIIETDGIFSLVSFDLETLNCTWAIADVKLNRQKAGKGRPLSKKQRQWRLQIPFDSLLLVRLHSGS